MVTTNNINNVMYSDSPDARSTHWFVQCLLMMFLLTLSACYKTVVPSGSVSKSASVYQVRSGDTLYNIANKYATDYQVLARRNRIRYPYRIYIGQRLYLKGTAPHSSYIPLPKKKKKMLHRRRTHTKKAPRQDVAKSRRAKRTSKTKYPHRVHLHWPVRGKVTDKFGIRHGRAHDGIDISVQEGTPVHAAAAGDVVYSNHQLTGYGNLIIIRHTRDMFTAYAHNQKNIARRGKHVKRGDVIAYAGHTGRASDSNLHFEIRRGPTPVNPLAYLPKR